MNTGCTSSQATRPKGIIETVSLMDTESSLTSTTGRSVRRRKRTRTKGRSGPISRVLSRTVIYLGTHVTVRLLARYPGAGRADP